MGELGAKKHPRENVMPPSDELDALRAAASVLQQIVDDPRRRDLAFLRHCVRGRRALLSLAASEPERARPLAEALQAAVQREPKEALALLLADAASESGGASNKPAREVAYAPAVRHVYSGGAYGQVDRHAMREASGTWMIDCSCASTRARVLFDARPSKQTAEASGALALLRALVGAEHGRLAEGLVAPLPAEDKVET